MIALNKNIIIILLILILIPTTVFGADLLYRLTHNDQDFLIIGELLEEREDSVVFKVLDNVVSESSLNKGRKIKKLEVDKLELKKEDLKTFNFMKYNGDKYLLSVDENNGIYKIAWGIYEIDSLDKSSLNIINSDLGDDEIFLKSFVNSDGKEHEFNMEDLKLNEEDNKKDNEIDKIESVKESGFKRRLPVLIIVLVLVVVLGLFKRK